MMATRFRTTDGTIALVNLDAQIGSLERQDARGRLLSRWSADLVDRLTLRGQILGRIIDSSGPPSWQTSLRAMPPETA